MKYLPAVALCLLSAPTSSAEPVRNFTVRVEDPGGLPVNFARVTLSNAARMLVAAGSTNEEGLLKFAGIAPGSYLLAAAADGFAEHRSVIQTGVLANFTVKLSVNPVVSEVTVSAAPGEVQALADISQRANVIQSEVIAERVVNSVTDAVETEPGVSAAKTTPWMGGVYVRGLTGKNVSVHKDGVRYTTSAQRGGVSTFFNANEGLGLASIEVLRGPNGAQYGSDSVGGAVNLTSRAPVFTDGPTRIRGEWSALYFSPSNTVSSNAMADFSGERWGLVSSVVGRRANNVRPGGGSDSRSALTRFLGLPSTIAGERVRDTDFTQYGGSLHSQVRLSATEQIAGHYERNQMDGARRSDQLLGGDGNLIADVANLMLDFGYLRFQSFRPGLLDQFSVTGSFNTQREERVNQGGQGNPAGGITHQHERVKSWGLNLFGQKRVAGHAVGAGAEGYHERMVAPAFTVAPTTGVVTLTRPRVPNGARYLNYGIFVQDSWQPFERDWLKVNGALRFGGASYRSRASESPLVGGQPLWPDDSLSANALSGRLGAVVRWWRPLSIHTQYSRGFRAPNMTDLGTLGIQGNGFFETSASALGGLRGLVGDRADDRAQSSGIAVEKLRPETSDNFDLGVAFDSGRVHAEGTAFWLNLGNTVVSQTLLLPPGAVGLTLGDQVVTRQLASGAVFVPAAVNPVLVRANYSGARLRGIEQSFRFKLTPAWHFRQNYTWVQARDERTGLPPDIEPGIPAPAVNLNVLFSPPAKRWWIEAYATLADRQDRLSSLALSDRRIGATRSRTNIQNFFRNGARVRGFVVNDRLVATGETLEQVQNRVLGSATSAPLFTYVPGYSVFGIRGGFPLRRNTQILVDFSNLSDKNYRGVGWGVDAPGRGVTVQVRRQF